MATCLPCDPSKHHEFAKNAIWELAQGNKRYVSARGVTSIERSQDKSVVDLLVEDPLRPSSTKAIVLACARSYAPIDSVRTIIRHP